MVVRGLVASRMAGSVWAVWRQSGGAVREGQELRIDGSNRTLRVASEPGASCLTCLLGFSVSQVDARKADNARSRLRHETVLPLHERLQCAEFERGVVLKIGFSALQIARDRFRN